MNKKHIKLYNLLFPIWFLILIHYTWVIVLPANFIIDLTVCVLTMKFLKVESIKEKVKSVIAKVWLLGFTSDFIGTAIMLLSNFIGTNEKSYRHD